jgi:hypothetical protein
MYLQLGTDDQGPNHSAEVGMRQGIFLDVYALQSMGWPTIKSITHRQTKDRYNCVQFKKGGQCM